jgi:cytochrome c551/c552
MNHRTIAAIIATLALVLYAGACKKKNEAPAGQPTTTEPSAAASVVEAKKIFKTRCIGCHGENGDGKGPNSAALAKPPANYTDPAFQAGITDEELKKAIIFGGKAVGKSELMLPNPDLENAAKAAVVDELVKIVRSFAPAGSVPAPGATPPGPPEGTNPPPADPEGTPPVAPPADEPPAPPKAGAGRGQGT